MTKKQTDKLAAIADLKQHIQRGDTLYTITRHRSASGMYRAIDVYKFHIIPVACGNCGNGNMPEDGICIGCKKPRAFQPQVLKRRWTWSVATALGYRYDRKHEAIGIGGCGFDAAHDIVYRLSMELFGDADSLHKEEI
jgi:uncharacterized OB-fold protein